MSVKKNIIFYLTAILILSLNFVAPCAAAIEKWSSTLPEDSHFKISEGLAERVEFWMKIYSHYNTSQGVFHLTDDPSFILGEVDFTAINDNAVLSNHEKQKQIQKLTELKRQELIQKWKISDAKKVRLQMGLKDRMQKAFFISGRYLPTMEKIFQKKGLPIELTRLVFVESSFNVLAQSKVGASGLWQIMPSVARPLGYMQAHYDKRNHPFYATELAAEILKTNYQKLDSWPLAITAYNHGLNGIRRMAQNNQTKQLEDLIESENVSRSWGFASKNFYACFLAVLEVEKNAHSLFGEQLFQSKLQTVKQINLRKALPQSQVLQLFNGSMTRFRQMNPHLHWSKIARKKKLPAGLPLIVPADTYHLVAHLHSANF